MAASPGLERVGPSEPLSKPDINTIFSGPGSSLYEARQRVCKASTKPAQKRRRAQTTRSQLRRWLIPIAAMAVVAVLTSG